MVAIVCLIEFPMERLEFSSNCCVSATVAAVLETSLVRSHLIPVPVPASVSDGVDPFVAAKPSIDSRASPYQSSPRHSYKTPPPPCSTPPAEIFTR